jgi:hypothetical protein
LAWEVTWAWISKPITTSQSPVLPSGWVMARLPPGTAAWR